MSECSGHQWGSAIRCWRCGGDRATETVAEVNDLRTQLADAVRERDEARERNTVCANNIAELQARLETAVEALEWYVGRLNGEHAARALDAIRGRGGVK